MDHLAKILLVEDHTELRHVLTHQLESMGFTALTAKNGREGVDTSRSGETGFDSDELYDARDGWLGSDPRIAGRSSD